MMMMMMMMKQIDSLIQCEASVPFGPRLNAATAKTSRELRPTSTHPVEISKD